MRAERRGRRVSATTSRMPEAVKQGESNQIKSNAKSLFYITKTQRNNTERNVDGEPVKAGRRRGRAAGDKQQDEAKQSKAKRIERTRKHAASR